MKLYNAMEESYLKENLIHKWVTNIVRQNDGYEFLLDDEVYLPVYKYALKITKRKTVKLNLVEEKVLQIVSIGVHQVDEIAKILGITRPLLDVTLADLHVKDLISVKQQSLPINNLLLASIFLLVFFHSHPDFLLRFFPNDNIR